MQKPILWVTMGAALCLTAACDKRGPTLSEEAEKSVIGVLDATDLNDIMLTVADPNEAVNYFLSASKEAPDRIEFRRGLGKSLIRAKRAAEAVQVYSGLVTQKESIPQDRVEYAGALIRVNEWKRAEEQLNKVPPTVETYQRYRLEAMVADSQKRWKHADSFYETATDLTTQPASVLNNWGYSKLSRGNYKEAEALFLESITYDKRLFTAKNNLVLARAAQKKYTLPIIPMSEQERAELLYSMGLAAVKQGDKQTGRGLIEEAIDVHPRHFEEAVRSLAAL